MVTMGGDSNIVEALQVHIPRPNEEFQQLIVSSAPTPEHDAVAESEKRQLILSRGGPQAMPSNESGYGEDPAFAWQDPQDEPLRRTLIPEPGVAIGYYRHLLETHGFDETEVDEQIGDEIELDPYTQFREALDERNRKLRLLDLLERRIELGDSLAAPYLDEKPCQWRSTNLSGEGRDIAEQIVNAIDQEPATCYLTARRAALLQQNNHRLASRISYVEGVALPETGGQAIRHAWIEIDNEVVEVTWPWHDLDGGEAVYFGYPVDMERVKARHEATIGGPIAPPRDVIERLVASGGSPQTKNAP